MTPQPDTFSEFDRRLAQDAAESQRRSDQDTRADAGAVIVVVKNLMRDLILHMPTYTHQIKSDGYMEAVKDIAITINAVTLRHDHATGELTAGGPALVLMPGVIVDAALADRK